MGTVKNNTRKIYCMGFLQSFMVVIPVFVPLLQGYGLSMSQVLQTQAVFALTIAACEVPSGYLADLWGRRNAIIVGSAINSLGFLWLLVSDSFTDFVVYELLLGVGFSLLSGADLALLYDSELYLQDKRQSGEGPGKSLSRLIAIEAFASGFAGVTASVLLIWSLEWVVLVQAITGLGPMLIGLTLVEPPRPAGTTSHSDNARQVWQVLVTGRPVVLWTAIAIAAFNLMALYAFWLYQKYWELQGVGIGLFGYIWAVFAVVTALTARYASAIEAKIGTRALLLALGLLPVFGLAGMALGSGWVGVAFGLLIQVARGASLTVFYEALNRRVPGNVRATINSLVSMGVRSGFIITAPMLGHMLDRHGMRETLSGLAVLLVPILALVLFHLLVRIRREPSGTVTA